MAQKLFCLLGNGDYTFLPSDDTIHRLVVEVILGDDGREVVLKQGKYAYKVKGGDGGSLHYQKGVGGTWVLIANWSFRGLYLTVRYRRSLWLKALYEELFKRMEFFSVDFCENGFELVKTDGSTLRGRKLNLSPPDSLERILTEKFHLPPKEIGELKSKLKIAWVL